MRNFKADHYNELIHSLFNSSVKITTFTPHLLHSTAVTLSEWLCVFQLCKFFHVGNIPHN